MFEFVGIMIALAAIQFLTWAIVFRREDRTRLIWRSVLMFALPITFLVIDNYFIGLLALLPAVCFIILEEALKFLSSRVSVTSRREALSIVLLFGAWETLITRPLSIIFQSIDFIEFVSQNLLSYVIVSILPVFMHGTTAAIYAIMWRKHGFLPLLICSSFHFVFNYSRVYYFKTESGFSVVDLSALFFDVVLFALIWFVLCLYYRKLRIAVSDVRQGPGTQY